jgi:uncharacterized membrane protein
VTAARDIVGGSRWNDSLAVLGGLAMYAALVLGGHAWLFGVPASSWMLF